MGELARQLLLHPAGYPHVLIAALVNQQITGARATAKSLRWYACDMRRLGIDVPERQKVHPAELDEQQSAAWLATVRVLQRVTD